MGHVTGVLGGAVASTASQASCVRSAVNGSNREADPSPPRLLVNFKSAALWLLLPTLHALVTEPVAPVKVQVGNLGRPSSCRLCVV